MHWHCSAVKPICIVFCRNRPDSTNIQMKLEVFSINSVDSTEVVVNIEAVKPFVLN
jgi:hypothetical protein